MTKHSPKKHLRKSDDLYNLFKTWIDYWHAELVARVNSSDAYGYWKNGMATEWTEACHADLKRLHEQRPWIARINDKPA